MKEVSIINFDKILKEKLDKNKEKIKNFSDINSIKDELFNKKITFKPYNINKWIPIDLDLKEIFTNKKCETINAMIFYKTSKI